MRHVEGALTPDPSSVRTVAAPEERSALCRRVLEALPDWCGLPDAVEQYVRDVASLPVLAVDDAGFLALKVHTDTSAEIHVMGVLPEHHHAGIGTALVTEAEGRRFYEAGGFRPLEELSAIWGEENPCLIMVKRL